MVGLSGCRSAATPTAPAAIDPSPTPDLAAAASSTPEPTLAPIPTETAEPTASPTPAHTETPAVAPTETQTPTATPTATAALARGADGLGDPIYPQMGNGGYDVQHYTIDLTVDVEENTIAGSTTLEAEATDNLDSFNLDFHGLRIGEVAEERQVSRHPRHRRVGQMSAAR